MTHRFLAFALLIALTGSCGPMPPDQPAASAPPRQDIDFAQARDRMVEGQIEARGVVDSRVLEAMLQVPRHEYVPTEYRAFAYSDTPLPIGLEQTISQPYVVALMTELIQPEAGDRTLESERVPDTRQRLRPNWSPRSTVSKSFRSWRAQRPTGSSGLGFRTCWSARVMGTSDGLNRARSMGSSSRRRPRTSLSHWSNS